jgi:hypothetical protein
MDPAHYLRGHGPSIGTRRWLPRGRLARRSRGLVLGGTWLRVQTRRRAHELDDELARGADPLDSDALSLRTGQLRSVETRARLARSLLAALELADREVPPTFAMVPLIRRPEVRGCRESLLELARRLHEDRDMNVQTLATISQLLTDGGSPLYNAHAEQSLAHVFRSALVASDAEA